MSIAQSLVHIGGSRWGYIPSVLKAVSGRRWGTDQRSGRLVAIPTLERPNAPASKRSHCPASYFYLFLEANMPRGGKRAGAGRKSNADIARAHGDYLVVAPTFPLLDLKAIPVFCWLIESLLHLGRFIAAPPHKCMFEAEIDALIEAVCIEQNET